jgi:hypothetical protein
LIALHSIARPCETVMKILICKEFLGILELNTSKRAAAVARIFIVSELLRQLSCKVANAALGERRVCLARFV